MGHFVLACLIDQCQGLVNDQSLGESSVEHRAFGRQVTFLLYRKQTSSRLTCLPRSRLGLDLAMSKHGLGRKTRYPGRYGSCCPTSPEPTPEAASRQAKAVGGVTSDVGPAVKTGISDHGLDGPIRPQTTAG